MQPVSKLFILCCFACALVANNLLQIECASALPPHPADISAALDTAEDTIRRLQHHESTFGRNKALDYSTSGSQWTNQRFKKHAWYNGNPDYLSEWNSRETEAIYSHITECLDLTIAKSRVYYDIFTQQTYGIFDVDYWWPETVGEASNFAIGSYYTGQIRDRLRESKESMLPQELSALTTSENQSASDWESFQELRSSLENTEQSHVEESAATPMMAQRNYEVHVYRTAFDTHLSQFAKDGGTWANFQCVADCIAYAAGRDLMNWSEMIAPLWRIPELSITRLGDDPLYDEAFQNVPQIALSPSRGGSGAAQLDAGGLYSNTCASYRIARMGNRLNHMFPQFQASTSSALERNCFHQSVGQLYPLVGTVEVGSSRTAPLAAIRRMFEWQSMNKWGEKKRQNYFNDRQGPGLWRWAGDERFKKDYDWGGLRSPDKLQRIYPEPSRCFTMDQIDERNYTLFPKGLFESDVESSGIYKAVHWNRRRCKVIIDEDGNCFKGYPLEE